MTIETVGGIKPKRTPAPFTHFCIGGYAIIMGLVLLVWTSAEPEIGGTLIMLSATALFAGTTVFVSAQEKVSLHVRLFLLLLVVLVDITASCALFELVYHHGPRFSV